MANLNLAQLKVLREMIVNNWTLAVGSPMGGSSQRFAIRSKGWKSVSFEDHNHPSDWWRANNIPSTFFTGLYRSKYVGRFSKTQPDKDLKSHLAWYEQPYGVTKSGREFWNTDGERLYNEALAADAAKREAVNRLVVVTAKSKYKPAHRNAGMLCRVVRETAKRLYVEPVSLHTSPDKIGELGEHFFHDYEYLDGRPHAYYVDMDRIFADDVTTKEFCRLVSMDNTIVGEYQALVAERDAEIAESRRRFAERIAQKEAEWAEMKSE